MKKYIYRLTSPICLTAQDQYKALLKYFQIKW